MDDQITQKEFSQALRRGLGSAIIALQNCEDKVAYRDIVLRCCLRDISYDRQTEGTKGRYLYSAICALGGRSYFEQAIIEKFLPRCEDNLFCQLMDILSCYAKDGSSLSKDALHAKYKYFSAKKGRLIKGRVDEGFQWENVACQLFTIDGFSAFKQYAMDMGELLNKNPDSQNVLYYDWFITEAEDTFGKKRVGFFIDKMYEKSDAIKVLIDTIKDEELSRKQYRGSYEKEQVTIEDILQAAREAALGESPYGVMACLRRQFMIGASDEEILELAHIVLREKDELIKAHLLRVFWRKPFPLGATPLIEYAQSDNEFLAENAMECLAELKDKRIHDLAIQLLISKGINTSALCLLRKNYRKDDDKIILRLIRSSVVTHHIQMDMVDIYTHHCSANALPILLRVYQKGDCSVCRFGIVRAMHYSKVLPDGVLAECLYDSYEDTRKFAKRLIANKKRSFT
jgi:hypothetical protein